MNAEEDTTALGARGNRLRHDRLVDCESCCSRDDQHEEADAHEPWLRVSFAQNVILSWHLPHKQYKECEHDHVHDQHDLPVLDTVEDHTKNQNWNEYTKLAYEVKEG